MSITAYNEGQTDLQNALTNLNQKVSTLQNMDELQNINTVHTIKNETQAVSKKHETIYNITSIATVLVVFITARVVLQKSSK
jgi:hypothetical protein